MLIQLNWIRGLAAVLIVFHHMTVGSYQTTEHQQIALNLLSLETTCIFVALSGFFFRYNLGKYSYQVYLGKKLQNVILPYLLISIPAVLLYVSGLKQEHEWIDMNAFHDWPPFAQTALLLATGAHLGPLWFIPALTLIFLLAPALEWIVKRGLLPAATMVGLLYFLVSDRPINDADPLLAALHFLPIYLCGMLACEQRERLQRPQARYWLLAALLLLSGAAVLDSAFYGLQKLALCLLLFAVFSQKIKAPGYAESRLTKGMALLGAYSFAIYFLHGYLAGAYRVLGRLLGEQNFAQYLGTRLCLTLITLLCCIAAVWVVKQVTRQRSRVLIGA